MNMSTTDRIEKQIFLKAPVKRVWRALTDPNEFNGWFRVKLQGPFKPGARVSGPVAYPGYEWLIMDITIERMEPEQVFAWRWHPHTIEPKRYYSSEPTTLVVFELQPVPGGTLLKVTESGFDALPADRREQAYRGNEGGWAAQLGNIEKHLSAAA
jgi:uncharacterized protein YndB with AHSA1/START domain